MVHHTHAPSTLTKYGHLVKRLDNKVVIISQTHRCFTTNTAFSAYTSVNCFHCLHYINTVYTVAYMSSLDVLLHIKSANGLDTLDGNDKSRPSLGLPQIWRCSPGPTASQAPGEERFSLNVFTVYQGKPSHQISLIITKRSFTGEHPGRLVVNQIRSMVSFSHQDVT